MSTGNKLQSYNAATDKLMQQAQGLKIINKTKFSLPEMVSLLRESFKYKITYKKVFNELLREKVDPATGFCIVSSFYIYERTGGDKVWNVMETPIHWWLEHKQTGEVFDITYTQFEDPFPYKMGTPVKKVKNDPRVIRILKEKALILGRAAGME